MGACVCIGAAAAGGGFVKRGRFPTGGVGAGRGVVDAGGAIRESLGGFCPIRGVGCGDGCKLAGPLGVFGFRGV